MWLFDLQATLAALGLVDGLLEPLAGAGRSTPWLEAARAFGRGDFRGAAEIYARVGAASEEAYARLLAAKALAAERRRSDADAELERALAFYRPVRATRYIRAAEALVTPTQATGATPAG